MFNKEFMITWDELAPSLQLLFNELQNQITDNANNISDINNKIDDKFDELKDYIDDQIDQSVTDIIKQMGEYDFINLAPKIGYYQEDTIEVISKYNMNYQVNYGNAITLENNGQEILYTIAGDGSYESQFELYKAVRNGLNTNFTFYNTPIRPNCLGGKRINSFRYVDNNHMICSGDGFTNALINTNYSSQDSYWEVMYESITSQLSKSGYSFYNCYITKDGLYLIVGFIKNAATNKDGNVHFSLRIVRLSDLKTLQEFEFDNIYNYIKLPNDTNYTFSNTKNNITDPFDPNAISIPINYWISPGFMFDEVNNTISINMQQMRSFYYVNTTFQYVEAFDSNFPICYSVPKSFWKGESDKVTSLITVKFKLRINYLKTFSNNLHAFYSYDHINNYAYKISKLRDDIIVRVICFDLDKMTEGVTQEHYGDNNNAILYQSDTLALSPDSSYWGKKLMKVPFMNDTMFIEGVSKTYWVKDIKVNKFQWKDQSKRIVEPMPGQYDVDEDSKYMNTIKSVYSTYNRTTCRASDDSVYYAYSEYINNKIITYRLQINDDFSSSWVKEKEIDFTFSYDMMDPEYQSKSIISIIPNFKKNEYLLIIRYNSSDKSLPHSHKMFFALLDKDGVFHPFGIDFISKFSSSINSINNYIHNNLPTTSILTIYHCIYDEVNDWYIFGGNWSRQQAYGTHYCMIKVINNNTDIECPQLRTASIIYDYTHHSINNWALTYSGPTYGYICPSTYDSNSWVENNKAMVTQKKIINDDTQNNGVDYSDEDFLFNAKGYKYSWFLQSATGLIAYIPNIPLFLGGYFSILDEALPVTLQPNATNYIYLERDKTDRNKLIASSSLLKDMEEGQPQFSKILLAKIVTNEDSPISTEYYTINTGYNAYKWK